MQKLYVAKKIRRNIIYNFDVIMTGEYVYGIRLIIQGRFKGKKSHLGKYVFFRDERLILFLLWNTFILAFS